MRNIADKKRGVNALLDFIKERTGSMTLESTLIFPLFLSLLFICICIGIVMLNVNTFQYIQLTAVERATFNWDEYDREYSSGIRQSTYRYGLYEHDMMLMMLNQLLQLNKPINHFELILHENDVGSTSGVLKKDKLTQLNSYVSSGNQKLTGTVSFEQRNFMPRVVLHIEPKPLMLDLKYKATSTSIVQDATQNIRGVDLIIYYSNKLKNQTMKKDEWLQKIKNALP